MGYQSKWTAEQKISIVMESLNTNISIAELCRKHNVTPSAFYGWRERFLEAGKHGLSSSGSPKDNHQNKELAAENDRLKKLIGELTIANDCLKKAMEGGKRR
jgi:transposase